MTGRPIVCPHCFYRNWLKYAPWEKSITDLSDCERCAKPLSVPPEDDGMETVKINGRTVTRKKKG